MREDLDADAEDGGGRALCATGAVDVEAFEDIVGIGVQTLRFQIQGYLLVTLHFTRL